MTTETIIVRWLGRKDYGYSWQAMQQFTNSRDEHTPDEIWLLEHPPVFTQGQNGKPEHVLNPGDIPIVQTDRGGQVTYHGPGQLMIYTLIDIKRKKMNIREFVTSLEQSIVHFLASFNVTGIAKREAPGVYVDGKKICSIGLRVRRGFSYHGIAFNVAMDLEPFTRINPCGFSQLQMTQLADVCINETITNLTVQWVGETLIPFLMKHLRYTDAVMPAKAGIQETETNSGCQPSLA